MGNIVNSTPAFFVVYDTKSKTYAMNRRFGTRTLNECLARYARVEGAQKDITQMESRGIDMTSAVIVPVFLSAGEAVKPKLRAKKSGFVIKFVETYWVEWEKKNKTRTTYWKGNKKTLPQTVAQLAAANKAHYDAEGYADRNEKWVLAGHRNNALRTAHYELFNKHVDSTVSATVFESKAKAFEHLNIMLVNLREYQKDFDPGTEHPSNAKVRNDRVDRTKISIVNV